MTEQEANALYDQGKEAVVAYLVEISSRVKALEARLGQNSHNSSKPPSSDPPSGRLKPMPTSLRQKSGKKPGGQKGHGGNTLQQVEVTDEQRIQDHRPAQCPRCRCDLSQVESAGYTRRQVFDIPQPVLEVLEHRAHSLVCPCCAAKVNADFPAGVDQPVQYGPNVVGLALYLHVQHLVPFARTAQIVGEVSGARLCQGTLHNALERGFVRLAPFEKDLQEALADAPILHVDETGVRQSKRRHWIHTRCTDQLCWLFAHARRGGAQVMADLAHYKGTLVSDFWGSYVGLDCRHQFCVAHLCRELQGVFELTKQPWAKDLKELLLYANAACHRARERGSPRLWNASAWAAQYDFLVQEGLRQSPRDASRKKQSKARNLVERLRDYHSECLGFLFDLSLPFTNNEAERSLRMVKVRAKVSGGFRTTAGVERFCRLRSYTQTCAKQELNVLRCIQSLFAGLPIMPSLTPA